MQQKGFRRVNIIDMAVAIVIVAILSSVLFPVFEDARSKAQDVACLSNMKQIGLGFMMYSQDYDEHFPIAKQWGWELYPYVKTAAIYQCPKDSSKSTNVVKPISYAMNSNMNKLNLKFVKAPASSILGTEYDLRDVIFTPANTPSIFSATDGIETSKIAAWGSVKKLGTQPTAPTKHDPNLVFLATDGHVSLLPPEQVSAGANALWSKATPAGDRAAGTSALSPKWTFTFSAI